MHSCDDWRDARRQEGVDRLHRRGALRDAEHHPKIIVHLDSHQATKIPGLKYENGAPGSQFPAKVDLQYHTDHIAPIVRDWAIKMQGYIMAANGPYYPADKYALSPHHIDFDAVAVYHRENDTIDLTYHCNPNRDAKDKDF